MVWVAAAEAAVRVDQIVALPTVSAGKVWCEAVDGERPRVLASTSDTVVALGPRDAGWRVLMEGVAFAGPVSGTFGVAYTRWVPGARAEVGALDPSGATLWKFPMDHLSNTETTPALYLSQATRLAAVGFHVGGLWMLRSPPAPREDSGKASGVHWSLGRPWPGGPGDGKVAWSTGLRMGSYDLVFRDDGAALLVAGDGALTVLLDDGSAAAVAPGRASRRARFATDGLVYSDDGDNVDVRLVRYDLVRQRQRWNVTLGPIAAYEADTDLDRVDDLRWLVIHGRVATVVKEKTGRVVKWKTPPDTTILAREPQGWSQPIVASCGDGWVVVGRTGGQLAAWHLR